MNIKTTMKTTMYDNLLLLPLFQGLSKNDLTTIIEKVKFHFLQYKEGEIFIHQGESCQQLCFLLSGQITIETADPKHAFSLSEVMEGPYIIEPQSLFGMQPNYTATYRAATPVSVLTIDKHFIFSELNNYEIFRLNFLNILSNQNQIAYQKLWHTHSGTLSEKFMNFIGIRCQKKTGEKVLHATMEDLASLIDETRINLSRLLNHLQTKGLVRLKRKEIHLPQFEKLTEYLIETHPTEENHELR